MGKIVGLRHIKTAALWMIIAQVFTLIALISELGCIFAMSVPRPAPPQHMPTTFLLATLALAEVILIIELAAAWRFWKGFRALELATGNMSFAAAARLVKYALVPAVIISIVLIPVILLYYTAVTLTVSPPIENARAQLFMLPLVNLDKLLPELTITQTAVLAVVAILTALYIMGYIGLLVGLWHTGDVANTPKPKIAVALLITAIPTAVIVPAGPVIAWLLTLHAWIFTYRSIKV